MLFLIGVNKKKYKTSGGISYSTNNLEIEISAIINERSVVLKVIKVYSSFYFQSLMRVSLTNFVLTLTN